MVLKINSQLWDEEQLTLSVIREILSKKLQTESKIPYRLADILWGFSDDFLLVTRQNAESPSDTNGEYFVNASYKQVSTHHDRLRKTESINNN
jgi:nuclear transport factor 2 (NTF2) superfamily protein